MLASGAYAAAASDDAVKAAFIYNFTKFVTWPAARASQPLVIGIYGKDSIAPVLDEAVKGKSVRGRAITVVQLSELEQVDECDLLVVASSEEDNLKQIFEELDGSPVLTVSDVDDFAERGGMISLTNNGRHVHFEINVGALERAGLRASSQLLRLAKIVGEAK